MTIKLDTIIQEARLLPLVPLAAVTEYQHKMQVLTGYVDEALTAEPAIAALIGNNPLQVMYDNHRHHAVFMMTVFSIGNYELLARTIPWVYRAYSAHKFSYDYFPLELGSWLRALDKHADSRLMGEIAHIYRWMIAHHADFVGLSKADVDLQLPISEEWLPRKNTFLAALLEGDHRECLRIASESVTTGRDVQDLYLQIIQPVMYEIGMLWERGTISVAQEHLASAVVGRVMATVSMTGVAVMVPKGKAVVAAAPNEFHEIGAWMVSDLLDHDGWQVKYLGANTPTGDLQALLVSFRPDVLVLSVTIPFNILKAKEVIAAVRADERLRGVRIIVGGQAFKETDDLWQAVGADGFAANALAALDVMNGWWADND